MIYIFLFINISKFCRHNICKEEYRSSNNGELLLLQIDIFGPGSHACFLICSAIAMTYLFVKAGSLKKHVTIVFVCFFVCFPPFLWKLPFSTYGASLMSTVIKLGNGSGNGNINFVIWSF